MVPKSARALALAAGLLAWTACDIGDFQDGQRYSEDFQRSYDLRPGGHLELESFNGSIELIGWERDRVEINGTKYASRKEALGDIKVEISNSPDSVLIRTQRPPREGWLKHTNMGVSYRIHVPRKVMVDRIATSNGSVRLEGLDGRCRVKTTNGAVRMLDLAGELNVETSNGRIELDRHSGAADLHTSNGAISVKRVQGSLAAATSNGAIDIDGEQLDPARPLKLDTSNGPIRVQFGARGVPELRAHTSNGRITVKLPDGAGARVRAVTSNAPIDSDVPMNNVTKTGKHRLEAEIGKGGPLLELTSSNGAIVLTRN